MDAKDSAGFVKHLGAHGSRLIASLLTLLCYYNNNNNNNNKSIHCSLNL